MHYDIYRLSLKEWLLYAGNGTVFTGLSAYIFYRSYLVFLFFLPLGLLYPLYIKRDLQNKRLQELNLQFKEAILILASSLNAGYSVENAFSASRKELEILYGSSGLITREFMYMQSQMKINRPVEQVLMDFALRSGLDDVKNFAEVFAAAKHSGGELIGIINHTAGIIGDKVQVQEDIITLTASKQFEQKIMNMIPFFIVIYIDLTSPGFFDLMYHTKIGRILMSACLGIYLLAYGLAQKIMRIEV